MADALKEVRQALLSADVHFKVAREFVARIEASCEGQAVLKSVTPGQQVVKIIHDELTQLLGAGATELEDKKPLRVMMVGLHGSGKTTSAAKLARYLSRKSNYRPALIACDVYRPAAIDQLETLAKAEACTFYADRGEKEVVKIAQTGLQAAKDADANLIIFDTAGRLQIETGLIDEIKRLKATVQPDEILLSSSFSAQLSDEFCISDRGTTQVKGFARPVQIAALESFTADTSVSQPRLQSAPS